MRITAKLLATGSYVPATRLENAELVQFPANARNLIEAKTGVKARHHAAEDEVTSDLAQYAAVACLREGQFNPEDLDAILLATSTPDRPLPATATRLQALIGARRAFAFDLNAVCAGSVYAIHVADALIRTGECKAVLVVAAEIYSRILNPHDFSTYPYFGDGAGAMLFVANDLVDGVGIAKTLLRSNGAGADLIQIPAGGSMLPASVAHDPKKNWFTMQGREVFDFATQQAPSVIEDLLIASALQRDDIDHVIAHQANINIINKISEAIRIPIDRFYINLDRIGNTAAASTMIALDELIRSGRATAGQRVLLVSFGGGLSWGASLIRL